MRGGGGGRERGAERGGEGVNALHTAMVAALRHF